MNQILESINNRDIASIILILVALGLVMLKKDLRKSVFSILKTFIQYQILIPIFLLFTYTSLIIFILDNIGFWNLSLVKDLIFWFVGSAFVLFMNLPKAMRDELHFKKIINENLNWAIIPQFVINLCDFSLITELVLLVSIFFTGIIVAATDLPRNKNIKNNAQVKRLMNGVLSYIGLCILVITLVNIVTGFKKFATLNNLYSFLLPLILTFALLPYLYFVALYMVYENIFIRSDDRLGREKQLGKYLKFKVYISCHLDLNKLRAFSTYMNFMQMRDKEGILKEMQDFEIHYKQKKSPRLT